MWGRDWEPLNGRVIATKDLRGGGNFQNRQCLIEYAVDGGPSQRVELKRVRGWGYFPPMLSPDEGDVVPLLLDRKSGKVRFDVKNPAINRKARLKADRAEADAEYNKKREG